MTTRFAGIMAAVTAAMLWGTTGTVQALLPAARDPLAVGALRLSFGALALLAMALAHGPSRRALRGLPWAGLALAGVAVAGYNLLFFRAVEIAGVGIGTAVAIGSAPLWTTAWEIAAQRLWPDRWRGAGQVVSVAGVVLLALAGGGAQGSALGVALAAGAGACYATYSLVTSRLGHRAPPLALAAATFGLGALLTLPVLLLAPPVWLSGAESWAAMAFLGIGATALSYALYTWGLARLAASTAVTLALAEPVTAWLLAVTVVGEPVTVPRLAGALLVLAGLVVVALVPARPAAAQPC
ncbi:DMT family transporter [Limimaricola hongkongensis]|uniref:DMT family transporter n=1 Tax=Limimaricola hongkongensis TaxID=278132 RepID=UPI0004768546|nr:DMT family transporter [Limimaricola hongkongensis]